MFMIYIFGCVAMHVIGFKGGYAMSTRAYTVNDYGLVMTRDMLKTICEKYFTGFTEKEYDEDEDSFNDVLWDGGLV